MKLTVDVTFFDGEFEESKHPRNHGKFSEIKGQTAAERYKVVEYMSVNEWLRGDRTPAAGTAKHNKEFIKELDDQISSNKILTPTIIYRGLGDIDAKTLAKTGRYREVGYVSGSKSEIIARLFSENDNYILKIHLPAGQNAHEFDDKKGEHELLLPRGTKFAVIGVNHQHKTISVKPITISR